jgi:ankyrin repeat protein
MNTNTRPLLTQLIQCAQHGSLNEVEQILQNPELDNTRLRNYGYEAVHTATLHNRTEIVRRLLQHPNIHGGRSLVFAVNSNNPELVQILLNHPSTTMELIQNALDISITSRRDETLKLLLNDSRCRLLNEFLWHQMNTQALYNMYLNEEQKSRSVLNILTDYWITYFPDDPLPLYLLEEYSKNLWAYSQPTPEKTWERRRHAIVLWHMTHPEYE